MSDSTFAPVAFEKAILKSDLDSSSLFTFLMGVFTMVYFGTLYAYLNRKTSQRRTVIVTITVIYVLSTIQFAIQWWLTDWEFIESGDTRDAIFNARAGLPTWWAVINAVDTFVVAILADGLLLWRCFHVWDGSPRVMALPALLWISEICLSSAAVVIQSIASSVLSTPRQVDLEGVISATANFTSFATTAVATGFIAYRIYSFGKIDAVSRSGHRFRRVLAIVVESSAVYAVSSLVCAITVLLGLQPSSSARTASAIEFGGALAFIISGMAPTVMVFRVALLAPGDVQFSTDNHGSGLRFAKQGCTTSTHGGTLDIGGTVSSSVGQTELGSSLGSTNEKLGV